VNQIVVLGLGRSGVAAAKAALAAGAQVIAVDEKPADDSSLQRAAEELGALGVEVVPGWKGQLGETGADTVVTSPGVPKDHPLLQRAVADGLEVISEVELAYRIAKDPIVAITGTNGKSTTTVMAWLCAQAAGYDAVLCGNIYGSGYEEVPLTEAALPPLPPGARREEEGGREVEVSPMNPSPGSQVHRPLPSERGEGTHGAEAGTASARAGETPALRRVLIAEVSSFQLEWVRDFRPQCATITNITADHLNRYAGVEEYAATKHRIFARMGPDEGAVWKDGDYATEPPHGVRTLTYGQGARDAWTDNLRMHLGSASIALAELPFSEPHNLHNAMAAGLLALGLGPGAGGAQSILEGLRRFRGLAHRMERLGERDGVLLINNSMCTNPAAVIASSRSLARRQRLLIGGVNKGLDFAPVGEYLRASGHAAYLFGSDAPAIGRQLGGEWPVFRTMDEALEAALADAKTGEAVMLAPGVASLDQFADFRERGEAFKRLARAWLGREEEGDGPGG
jgi:UDP-N-acetylmuramoylalanine--D-glutamate ligase